MNTEMTDLLHDSINRLTAGERMPAGLAERAARRNQQRRTALRTATATGVAAIAAAATLVAATATSGVPHRGLPPTLTTAYVISQTERALAAAARGGAIERIVATGHDETLGPEYIYTRGGSSYGRGLPGPAGGAITRTVVWWYRGHHRIEGLTAGGGPAFDTGTTAATGSPAHHHAGYFTLVDYPAKTWLRNLGDRGGPGLRPSCWEPIDPQSSVGVPPGQWVAMVRKALSCRELKLDGHQWVHGVRAIKIIAEPRLGKAVQDFARFHGTLWVDPATYLPVRVKWTWPNGELAGSFQWLPRTRANLAALNVTIPRGFRPVSLPHGSQLIFVAGMSNAPPKGR
jgi:hypothetical protein